MLDGSRLEKDSGPFEDVVESTPLRVVCLLGGG